MKSITKGLKNDINKLFDKAIDGAPAATFEIDGTMYKYVTYYNGEVKSEGAECTRSFLSPNELKQVTLDMMKEQAKKYSTIVWRRDPECEKRYDAKPDGNGRWTIITDGVNESPHTYDINLRCAFIDRKGM